MLGPVSPDEIRAAQILTGATMAAWLAAGWTPNARPYTTKIRAGLLIAYLLGCASVVLYALYR